VDEDSATRMFYLEVGSAADLLAFHSRDEGDGTERPGGVKTIAGFVSEKPYVSIAQDRCYAPAKAVDLIRESVRTVLQELIETEAAEFIGATRCERSESRTNERNGSRPRMLPRRPVTLTCESRSCARVRSFRRSSSHAGVATRRCTPW
jgi:hypothetical protein